VGALDSIADIVGAAAGLELLGIEKCVFGAVATGSGTVRTAHGVLPVPAPATAQLLAGALLAESVETGELTTPTGAAIAAELAAGFGPLPAMVLRAVGNGAGSREGKTVPNVLRVFIGEPSGDATPKTVTVIETAIDDMAAEALGYAQEALFAAGALDAYFTPIVMKKGRPAQLLTVLVERGKKETVLETLFRETSTFVARVADWGRETLSRETVECECELGRFRVKVGTWRGKVVSRTPEYEDARRIAAEKGLAFRQVYQRLQAASRLENT